MGVGRGVRNWQLLLGNRLGISQRVVSNCIVHHLFCIFFYHYYCNYFLFLCCPIKLFLSQPTNFTSFPPSHWQGGDPADSASQRTGTTGVCHHARQRQLALFDHPHGKKYFS
uniref:Uncharacterized protein n=1 Tax=Calidris pygmaea TaxID=425635 RepID=A0A8C3KGJ2_9CHAR